MLLNFSAVSHN